MYYKRALFTMQIPRRFIRRSSRLGGIILLGSAGIPRRRDTIRSCVHVRAHGRRAFVVPQLRGSAPRRRFRMRQFPIDA